TSDIYDDLNRVSFEEYDKLVNKLKNNGLVKEFVAKAQKMISLFDPKDIKYDEKVVMFVMESAEMFFLDRKCGTLKKQVVIEVLLPFFNDDTLLVEKFIQLCHSTIRKANM